MTNKTGKELTLEWFDRVWNSCDETAIHELMSESCEVKGLNLDEKGPGAFLKFHRAYCNAFNSIKINVFEMVEEDDFVIGHAQFTAIHKKTQREIDMVFSLSVKWVNGIAIEARNIVDFTTMLSQLGLLDLNIISEALED